MHCNCLKTTSQRSFVLVPHPWPITTPLFSYGDSLPSFIRFFRELSQAVHRMGKSLIALKLLAFDKAAPAPSSIVRLFLSYSSECESRSLATISLEHSHHTRCDSYKKPWYPMLAYSNEVSVSSSFISSRSAKRVTTAVPRSSSVAD
jgi:hypothetical protein